MIDCLVVGLAASRVLGLFFFSGHVLFLVYSFLTTNNFGYRVFAACLIMETVIFKIFVWQDLFTPLAGLVIVAFFLNLRESRLKSYDSW